MVYKYSYSAIHVPCQPCPVRSGLSPVRPWQGSRPGCLGIAPVAGQRRQRCENPTAEVGKTRPRAFVPYRGCQRFEASRAGTPTRAAAGQVLVGQVSARPTASAGPGTSDVPRCSGRWLPILRTPRPPIEVGGGGSAAASRDSNHVHRGSDMNFEKVSLLLVHLAGPFTGFWFF